VEKKHTTKLSQLNKEGPPTVQRTSEIRKPDETLVKDLLKIFTRLAEFSLTIEDFKKDFTQAETSIFWER